MALEANLTHRRFHLALWLCLTAPAAAGAQTALPPPPYAASPTSETGRPLQSGATYDRYGGGTVHRSQGADQTAAGGQARPSAGYAGARLTWTGKAAMAAPAQSAPSAEGWRRMTTRAAYAPAMSTPAPRARLQYPSMTAKASNTTTAPAPQATAASTPYTPEPYTPPPAPTSIYDPAPPPAPTHTAAAQPGEGPRLYSVHRDYGMQPDPIPLAPQFFGPTADLTTPETPEVGHRAKTSTGALVNTPTDAGAAP